MDALIDMAIEFILSGLQIVVKNPAKKAALQTRLIEVANDIYIAYGITPPTPPTA
jgi:hypothetical protein